MNGVPHSEICAVPAVRLDAERDLLTALPSLRPAIGKAAVTRKVDRLWCIRFGSARCSVPTRLIGQRVAVTESGGRLLVADAVTGEVIASHAPAAPGEARVLDEHYGGPRPEPRRAVRAKTAAEKAFLALGQAAEAFLTGSAASGNTKLAADLDELAGLRAAHGDQALTAALERAVAFRRWRPPTSGPSWPPGPGPRSPARPGTPWSSSWPRSRSARCRPTRSKAPHDRHRPGAVTEGCSRPGRWLPRRTPCTPPPRHRARRHPRPVPDHR